MKNLSIALCALTAILLSLPAAASIRQEVIAGPVQGQVLDILDGDTVTVRLHVWIGQNIETSVRIAGIDTPEMKGKCKAERAKAIEARDEIANLLADNKIQLSNVRLEKYAGRVLAEAYATDGTNIKDHMIRKGLARSYGGEKRMSWCS